METSRSLTRILRHGAVLLCACAGMVPAFADDSASAAAAANNAAEREALAALARQLDLLDRLAEHAAASSPHERARYHFDYARLREDVKRVRSGVQDYLVPQRAQPRDPLPLSGDYTRSGAVDNK